MNSDALHIVYVAGAALFAGIMAFKCKSDHKFIAFFITFWILGGSVIRQEMFVLKFSGLGGDLQIKRIIFLLLTAYLLFTYFLKLKNRTILRRLPYEKYLYAFVLWFVVVLFYHIYSGVLQVKEVVVLLQGILSVLALYIVLKRDADLEMIRVFTRALMGVAVVSAIVGIIQFFVDPYFLRIGVLYPAFGGKFRASGVYWSEYMHSYTLVAALALALVTMKAGKERMLITGIYLAGIILSFHRMSWIVTAVIITFYFVMTKREKILKFTAAGSIVLFTIFVVATQVVPIVEDISQSDVYQSRLSSDTMTHRLKFYNMVIERIDQIFFWGAGSKSSNLYYYGMLSTGIVGKEWALGEVGSIHNLYLELLFFYGIPLLLLFIIMLISMMRNYIKVFISGSRQMIFTFLFLIIYTLMNLTNSFPFQGDFGFLFGIVLGCSAAVAVRQNIMQTTNFLAGNNALHA